MRNRRTSPLVAVLALLLAYAHPAWAQATLFRAARIYTMEQDSLYTRTPAVGVARGRVVAVGDSATVAAALGPGYTVNRWFADKVLFPGFVEAHSHFQSYGVDAAVPYVGYWPRPMPDGSIQAGVTTREAMIGTLREAAESTTAPALFAYGADPIYWNGSRLTREILDLASDKLPIMVQLSSGHIVVCNTPMMNLVMQSPQWASLSNTPAVVRLNGQPTGELDELPGLEMAFGAFLKAYPAFALNTLNTIGSLTRAADLMRRQGITTATDLFFGEGAPELEKLALILYQTAEEGDPKFPRVYLAYSGQALLQNYGDSAVAHLDSVASRSRGRKVQVGPVKFVVDGSIQGYTGVLTYAYANPPAPGANPYWNVPPDSLYAWALPFWQSGYQLAVHVNGDSATSIMVGTLRRLLAATPQRTDHRTTFEHNTSARPDHYDSIQALGGTVNVFSGHVYYWGRQHQLYTLGDSAADMSAADWALQRGIPFSLHTDAPVTPAAPLVAAWAAVNRLMSNGSVLGPQHRITVGQALRAVTMGGAYLLHADSVIGSIKPGKYADFTVLGADPFAVPGERLCEVPIVATVIGGQAWLPTTDTETFCPASGAARVAGPAAERRE